MRAIFRTALPGRPVKDHVVDVPVLPRKGEVVELPGGPYRVHEVVHFLETDDKRPIVVLKEPR